MADNKFDLELGLDFSKVTEALQQIKSQFSGTGAEFQKIANKFKDSFNTMTNSIKLYGMESSQAKTATKSMERAMVELTKNGIDPASQGFQQLNSQIGPLASKMKGAGDSVKKSNMQFTNLALVIQDLPYGFRGIQNNLPAVIGGFAGMTGAIYLASSVIIAFFTAWDNGMIKFGNSVKLSTDFSKEAATAYANETIKLESLYRVATNSNQSMYNRLEAAKELKKEYPGLLDTYSNEEIALGKAKTAYEELTTTIWKYALAQAATKALEEIAAKKLPLMIEKTKLLAKERKLAAIQGSQETLQGINVYSQYNSQLANVRQEIKDNTKEQENLSKAASEYTPVIDANINALSKLDEFKTKDKEAIKASKEEASAAKKYKEDKNKAIEETSKAELEGHLTTLSLQQKEEYVVNKKFIDLEANARKYGLATIGLEEARLKEINSIREKYDLKDQERSDKSIKDNIDFETKIYNDSSKALSDIEKEKAKEQKKILDRQFQNEMDAIKNRLSAQLKGNRKEPIKQQQNYKEAIAGYVLMAMQAGLTEEEIDKLQDKINSLNSAAEGSASAFTPLADVLNNLATNTLVEFGTQLGNLFSGEEFSFDGFITMLADAIIEIGKHLLVVSGLFAAVDALFKNPATWPVAIAVGVAAIAAGTALKNSISKKNPVSKFANGGIVSGPTMGLMGEYPGAKSNPEVIAPLDKLKSMIGGSGGQFLLRGQDLLLAVNRAQKASNLKGQNISLA